MTIVDLDQTRASGTALVNYPKHNIRIWAPEPGRDSATVAWDDGGYPMSAAENNDHQCSWGSILLIYGIGVLGATTISQAITVARDMATFFHAAPQQAGWIISTPSAL